MARPREVRRAPRLADRAGDPDPRPEPHRGVRGGGQTSIAAAASTIVRRPLVSSRLVPTVSVPFHGHALPCVEERARTDITDGFGVPSPGVGVEPPRGDGVGAGWAVITTSPRSRSHNR